MKPTTLRLQLFQHLFTISPGQKGDPMKEKRKINGRLILGDLRAGMTDRELRIKYRLSTNGLRNIFEKLVAHQAISHSELGKISPSYMARICHNDKRGCPRVDLALYIPVYDLGGLATGALRDLSENGLRIAGIEARPGQAKTFQIPINTFMNADPVLVVAECRWVETTGKDNEYNLAGFEIIDISDTDRQSLRNFMKFLLLSESGEWQAIDGTGAQNLRRYG